MVVDDLKELEEKSRKPLTSLEDNYEIQNIIDKIAKQLFVLYARQDNKETWLEREIKSFNEKNIIFIDESILFNEAYQQSYIRFDFITDYLNEHEFQFDLTSIVIEEFDKIKFSDEKKCVFVRFAACFASFLRKDEFLLKLILRLIDFYYQADGLIDKTTAHEINAALYSKYEKTELERFRVKHELISKILEEY